MAGFTKIHGSLPSLLQTQFLGRSLVTQLRVMRQDRAVFVGFSGPLGVGKTELIRTMLRSLGIEGDITSPTFVFECIYETGPQTIVHWDLYRWNTTTVPQEFFDYRRSSGALIFVEWPERARDLADLLDIRIVLRFAGSNNDSAREFEILLNKSTMDINILVSDLASAGIPTSLMQI